MKYVAAYLLANLGGNANPTTKDLEKILKSGGINFDGGSADTVVNALKGKSIEELIAAGQSKLASVPCASAAVVSAAPTGGKPTVESAPAKEEKKKEEKKEESEDEDMGFGLFD